MAKKSLPIGNDDFTELRINNSYYVDKTLMIRDFIEMNDKVALIARQRTFGQAGRGKSFYQAPAVWKNFEYVDDESIF